MRKFLSLIFLCSLLLSLNLKFRYADHPDFTRFVVEGDTEFVYDIIRQDDFTVDILLPGKANWEPPAGESALLQKVEINRSEEVLEVRLHFSKAVIWSSFTLRSPFRLVLDFRPRPISPKIKRGIVRTIVLDPGHGGEETGSIGPSGTKEKDLTLIIAKKLRNILRNSLGVRVILTREDDVYVSLDERTAIANNAKADIFISIHFNASRNRKAKGPETYFLSYKATDSAARLQAYRENMALVMPPEDIKIPTDVEMILWDMAQSQYLQQSSRLAEFIQEELSNLIGVKKRGVKQAPFKVLMGALMPAVLVEVDFLSNPEEEKKLLDPEFQNKIAMSLYRGIVRFIQFYQR